MVTCAFALTTVSPKQAYDLRSLSRKRLIDTMSYAEYRPQHSIYLPLLRRQGGAPPNLLLQYFLVVRVQCHECILDISLSEPVGRVQDCK